MCLNGGNTSHLFHNFYCRALKFSYKLLYVIGFDLVSSWLHLYMCFTPDARGTEYYNSVPAGIGTEFQNDHECEARGIHFSLGARVPNIIHHEGRGCICNAYKDQRDI